MSLLIVDWSDIIDDTYFVGICKTVLRHFDQRKVPPPPRSAQIDEHKSKFSKREEKKLSKVSVSVVDVIFFHQTRQICMRRGHLGHAVGNLDLRRRGSLYRSAPDPIQNRVSPMEAPMQIRCFGLARSTRPGVSSLVPLAVTTRGDVIAPFKFDYRGSVARPSRSEQKSLLISYLIPKQTRLG